MKYSKHQVISTPIQLRYRFNTRNIVFPHKLGGRVKHTLKYRANKNKCSQTGGLLNKRSDFVSNYLSFKILEIIALLLCKLKYFVLKL